MTENAPEDEGTVGPPEGMDQDQEQSLAWAPKGYAAMDPSKRGRWALIGEDTIAWTDDEDGAGVGWLTDSETGMALRQYLLQCRSAGVPATTAYQLVLRRAGDAVRMKDSGRLEDVDGLRAELMDDD